MGLFYTSYSWRFVAKVLKICCVTSQGRQTQRQGQSSDWIYNFFIQVKLAQKEHVYIFHEPQ